MSAALEPRLFGAVERRLFRVVAVLTATVVLLGLIAGIIWILGQTLLFFYSLIMPLCVAGILALVLYPVVDCLEQRLGMPRIAASGLMVFILIAVILGAIFMVVPTTVYQMGQIAEFAPGILAGWDEYLRQRFPAITGMLVNRLEEGGIGEFLPGMESAGRTARSYAGILAGLSFVPLLLFFGLLSGDRLRIQTTKVLTIFSAGTQQKIIYFIDVFLAQVTGFFQGQFVIAVIMAIMYATGFTLIGLKAGIVIGLVLGLLNIVPYLGTLIGLLIVLPLAYLQPSGGLQLLGMALVVFTFVQLVESWLLTPKIMADRSGLHPVLVVIAVFFWGTALGSITGMILAVPLTAFLVAVWMQAKAGLARSMTPDDESGRIAVHTGNVEASILRDPRKSPAHDRSSVRRTSSTNKQKS